MLQALKAWFTKDITRSMHIFHKVSFRFEQRPNKSRALFPALCLDVTSPHVDFDLIIWMWCFTFRVYNSAGNTGSWIDLSSRFSLKTGVSMESARVYLALSPLLCHWVEDKVLSLCWMPWAISFYFGPPKK